MTPRAEEKLERKRLKKSGVVPQLLGSATWWRALKKMTPYRHDGAGSFLRLYLARASPGCRESGGPAPTKSQRWQLQALVLGPGETHSQTFEAVRSQRSGIQFQNVERGWTFQSPQA